MFSKLIFLSILLFSIVNIAKADSVCDLETFLQEVKEDLKDNGMLDCLRVIPPPNFVVETEEQKNLRLAAQWDTECAFEAQNNWMKLLKDHYSVTTLVDVIGEPVKKDFDDQADLCEILRAGLSKGLFMQDVNMQALPEKILDQIQCAGSGGLEKRTQICAASGSSYFQRDSWSIFLQTSSIKIDNKPMFIRQRPKSKYDKFSGANDKIIEDLVKMGKKGLKDNEAKLAGIIDNLSKNGVKVKKEDKKDVNKKAVHIHYKRVATMALESKNGYQIYDSGLNFQVDKTKLIFGFYMMSYKFDTAANDITTKLYLSNREIQESRNGLGKFKQGALTGSFAEVYYPDGKAINVNLYYKITGQGRIQDNMKDNFTIGAISLPVGSVFKHNNSQSILFKKTKEFKPVPNFILSINYKEKVPFFFLIFYNIALKFDQDSTFTTRMTIDGNAHKDSTATTGPSRIVGNHGATVLKLKPGAHKIGADYMYSGDDYSVNDFSDQRFTQSITAFQLPDSTVTHFAKNEQHLDLNSKGSWKSLNTTFKLTLEKEKTILIIYNINVEVGKKEMVTRFRIEKRYNKKSIMTSKDLDYNRVTGYVMYVLKKGSYQMDLEFNSDSDKKYDGSDKTKPQDISMHIIEFD